jgi:hypothetical protein
MAENTSNDLAYICRCESVMGLFPQLADSLSAECRRSSLVLANGLSHSQTNCFAVSSKKSTKVDGKTYTTNTLPSFFCSNIALMSEATVTGCVAQRLKNLSVSQVQYMNAAKLGACNRWDMLPKGRCFIDKDDFKFSTPKTNTVPPTPKDLPSFPVLAPCE